MAAYSLIANTTSADTSSPFQVTGERTTFIATGTYAATEDATLQVSPDGGTTWINVVEAAVTKVLDEENTVMTVYGRGLYRFNKGTSVAASGVAVAD